jgi:hypothetical protein
VYTGKTNLIINKSYSSIENAKICKIQNLTCNSSYSTFFKSDIKSKIIDGNIIVDGECDISNKITLIVYNNPNISFPYNNDTYINGSFYYGLPNLCGAGIRALINTSIFSALLRRVLLYTNTSLFNSTTFIHEDGSLNSYIARTFVNNSFSDCFTSFVYCQGYNVVYYYKFD